MRPPQQVAFYSMPSQADAVRYSWAVISWAATTSQLAQLKTWNPSIKLFYYRNFAGSNGNAIEQWGGEGAGQSDTIFFRSKGWLLKDSSGNEIIPASLPNERMIDPGNPDYKSWLANYLQWIYSKGYHGIMADNMPAPTYPATWSVPVRGINPRKNTAYLDVDWYTDSLALATATRIPIIGNGIPQGDGAYGYWSNKTRCDNIIANIDGILIEGPVGWSHTDLMSRGESVWKQNIDFIKTVIDSGKTCWFSNGGASDMENDHDALYVYCTYMMTGPISNCALKFRGLTYMSGSYWSALVSQNLGDPLGSYYKDSTTGDYIRKFSTGIVHINPVTKKSSISGSKIVTSVFAPA